MKIEKSTLAMGIVAVMFMTACSDENISNEIQTQKNEYVSIPLSRAERQVANQSGAFGWDLLDASQSSNTENENIVISPFGATINMAMLANGANGETYNQIISTAGFDDCAIEDINSYCSKLLSGLPKCDTQAELNLANAIWSSGVTFKTEAIDQLKNNFGLSYFIPGDNLNSEFRSWVKSSLKDYKINEFPEYDALLVLYGHAVTNLFGFKNKWSVPFDKDLSENGIFNNADGSTTEVTYMKTNYVMPCIAVDGFTLASIQLGNGAFRLCLILPDEGEDITTCTKLLSEIWSSANDMLPYESLEADIMLPRFCINSMADLVAPLKMMGYTLLGGKADFSNFFIDPVTDSNPFNSMIQLNNLSVDEEGVESSSVTSSTLSAISPSIDGKVKLHLTRPFIFTLIENSTNTMLMTGIINKI